MVVGTDRRRGLRLPAISFLLRWSDAPATAPFVYYRYAAGVAILLIIATGLRPATF